MGLYEILFSETSNEKLETEKVNLNLDEQIKNKAEELRLLKITKTYEETVLVASQVLLNKLEKLSTKYTQEVEDAHKSYEETIKEAQLNREHSYRQEE